MLNGFIFKEFAIQQDRCAMKVGTDGVLLGAWARGGKRILDIGSGTGLIAMMMAQRFRDAIVEGVEIAPLQAWEPEAPFDAMVTNPPFFLNSLQAPDKARARARNAEFLPFANIFSFVRRWLAETGHLSAVVPAEAYEAFATEAFLQGFFLERLYHVRSTLRKPVRRCLVSFARLRPEMYEEKTVELMAPDGGRSAWYGALTEDFYVK